MRPTDFPPSVDQMRNHLQWQVRLPNHFGATANLRDLMDGERQARADKGAPRLSHVVAVGACNADENSIDVG